MKSHNFMYNCEQILKNGFSSHELCPMELCPINRHEINLVSHDQNLSRKTVSQLECNTELKNIKSASHTATAHIVS